MFIGPNTDSRKIKIIVLKINNFNIRRSIDKAVPREKRIKVIKIRRAMLVICLLWAYLMTNMWVYVGCLCENHYTIYNMSKWKSKRLSKYI